ncbi:unnamed protein product [Oikopleura dioica]|uniref:Uncharacterized protein n=1 Tax=Oikopleura dioica TaxID=34765 RepID=E4YQW0_OIKDI|nr:unnamed protein product [Oikopleura dioica]
MMCQFNLNDFWNERVLPQQQNTALRLRESVHIVSELLKEVEKSEPRFVGNLQEIDGRIEGLHVVSQHEIEVHLYLNQMGVFNLVDDGSVSGCASLKLSDGRKRSMSLWVEFITASGYLSSRKIRARFQGLLATALENSAFNSIAALNPNATEAILTIRNGFIVRIVPAFRCGGMWPRSAQHWPQSQLWPAPQVVSAVKSEGFTLLSRDGIAGDSWAFSFAEAYTSLLEDGNRKINKLKVCSNNAFKPGLLLSKHLESLLLIECEKHPSDDRWKPEDFGDRLIGILLQSISCMQSRKCPHYILDNVDLFAGYEPTILNEMAKLAWNSVRLLIIGKLDAL